jgi:hypothetical protein
MLKKCRSENSQVRALRGLKRSFRESPHVRTRERFCDFSSTKPANPAKPGKDCK